MRSVPPLLLCWLYLAVTRVAGDDDDCTYRGAVLEFSPESTDREEDAEEVKLKNLVTYEEEIQKAVAMVSRLRVCRHLIR